ncbi:HK97 family phage prohead protease [Rhodococcus hoagii]|nr:HK97 family phage prohead protease [Prescottella equi]NKZ92220.1 HK97 family phage prohead protease [Prescottella equi]
MYIKEFATRVKAAGPADGLGEGQVRAIVSVFGNVDSVGDIVMPGAFAEDIAAWTAKGDPIPAIWSHDWRDPFSHIGTVLEAAEAEKGLEVLYQCDLDNPKAVQCYRLLKGRRVTQSSFAYDILDAGWAKRTDPATGKEYEVYELRKLHIIEVGPTLVGANQETELLAVKSAELTRALGRGRTISPKSLDQLVAAHESIGQLIESAKADDAKTSGRAPDAAPAADATHTGQPDAETASDERGDGAAKSSAQSSADRSAQVRARLALSIA